HKHSTHSCWPPTRYILSSSHLTNIPIITIHLILYLDSSEEKQRMVPYLPIELIARCIQYAIVPSAPANRDTRGEPSTANNLAMFCRVNRAFYILSAPVLYREIIVCGNRNFLLQIFPLLSRVQRRSVRALIAEHGIPIPRQLDELLRVPADRRVFPGWVKGLKIFSGYNITPEAAVLWLLLNEVAREMVKLENVIWEPSDGSTSLANIIGGLPNLMNIACSANGPMCDPHIESGFQNIRLRSLTVYCDGTDDGDMIAVGGQRNLIRPSAGTLEALHLTFRRVGVINAEEHIVEMLRGTTSFDMLRDLRLGFFELSTIVALGMVVRFSALESLQLVHETVCPGLPAGLLRAGRLSALTTLSATLSPNQMLEIINACDRLRKLYVFYHRETDPNADIINAADIVEAVGKHGYTLTVLCLCEGYRNEASALTMRRRDIAKLVQVCPELEELRIGVRMEEFTNTPSLFRELQHLKHLYVELFGIYRNWFAEPGYADDITPLCPSWLIQPERVDVDPEEQPQGSRSRITHLEIGMCLMLISFKALPLTFSISSCGVFANDPILRLSQTYRITEGVSPCNPQESLGDDIMFCGHRGNMCGVHWLAPPGFRYALMNYDGNPFQAEVLNMPGNHDPDTVGSWVTAFKASCLRNIGCEIPLF
ncbi:hypothetical protein DFP73DRAFT_615986, partial [Morchella snyderi]